jgi:hypothetical protein
MDVVLLRQDSELFVLFWRHTRPGSNAGESQLEEPEMEVGGKEIKIAGDIKK